MKKYRAIWMTTGIDNYRESISIMEDFRALYRRSRRKKYRAI